MKIIIGCSPNSKHTSDRSLNRASDLNQRYVRNTMTTVKPILFERWAEFGVLFTLFYSLFWVLGGAFQSCSWVYGKSPLRIRNKNTKSCELAATSHPGVKGWELVEWQCTHSILPVHDSATIHIHLYNNHIYNDHIRERASTWGVSFRISFTHSPWLHESHPTSEPEQHRKHGICLRMKTRILFNFVVSSSESQNPSSE